MEEKSSEIRWHRWFGSWFKETLSPLGIEVHTEFPIMTDPPGFLQGSLETGKT